MTVSNVDEIYYRRGAVVLTGGVVVVVVVMTMVDTNGNIRFPLLRVLVSCIGGGDGRVVKRA